MPQRDLLQSKLGLDGACPGRHSIGINVSLISASKQPFSAEPFSVQPLVLPERHASLAASRLLLLPQAWLGRRFFPELWPQPLLPALVGLCLFSLRQVEPRQAPPVPRRLLPHPFVAAEGAGEAAEP